MLLQRKCFKVDKKNMEIIYPKLMLKILHVQKGVNHIIYSHMLQKCCFWRLGYLFGYRKPLIIGVEKVFLRRAGS